MTAIVLAVMLLAPPSPESTTPRPRAEALDATAAARFAALALDCVAREYPNKIAHVLSGRRRRASAAPLTPAFYGCYDWHSAVHGHWLLARLARTLPERALRRAGARGPGPEPHPRQHRGRGRLHPRQGPHDLRAALRPGLAPPARGRAAGVGRRRRRAPGPPRSRRSRRKRRCGSSSGCPKLSRPIRVGEHDQTAFAFGLVLDWARSGGAGRARATSSRHAPATSTSADRDCPMRLRALRAGLRLALPGRGGPHAAAPARAALRDLAVRLPARRSRRDPAPAWLAPAVVTDPDRPQARAPRRPEPQPRVDARGDRLRAPARRSPPARAARRVARASARPAWRRSRARTTRAATGWAPSPCT